MACHNGPAARQHLRQNKDTEAIRELALGEPRPATGAAIVPFSHPKELSEQSWGDLVLRDLAWR